LVAEYASNLKVKYEPRKKSLLSLLSHRKDKGYQFIATFSAFGAHYMNNSLYTKLGEWLPPYDWKQGVKEAIEGYLCK
jgi:hypothetical protein